MAEQRIMTIYQNIDGERMLVFRFDSVPQNPFYKIFFKGVMTRLELFNAHNHPQAEQYRRVK